MSGNMQARGLATSGKGRGLAPKLEGMQQQMADLDAMWNTVKAPKVSSPRTELVSAPPCS